jgi:release factor glutamine methyltransferase
MLPTPPTPNLPETIYPPSEDSYLVLDTLSCASETAFLHERFSPATQTANTSPSPLVVDVGTGSGILLALVLAHAHTLLGRTDVLGLGIDVNPDACTYAGHTVQRTCSEVQQQQHSTSNRSDSSKPGTYLTTLHTSLLSAIRPHTIDMLVFNPPYVPTDTLPAAAAPALTAIAAAAAAVQESEFERTSRLLALTYAGGKDGMQVTNAVLDDLARVLSPRGVAYVLLCKANRVEEVIGRVHAWNGVKDQDGEGRWAAEVVGTSGLQAGWEKLVVVRIWRVLAREGIA